MILVSMVASGMAVVATAWRYITLRKSAIAKVKAKLVETKLTAVWIPFMLVAAVLLWYGKLTNASMAGNDLPSWLFVASLAFLCALGVCVLFLITFVKATYATQHGLVAVSLWGLETSIAWTDVVRIAPIMLSRSFHVMGADGTRITVGGDLAGYPDFLTFMIGHVRDAECREALGEIRNRFMRQQRSN
jgi:hypothetical protein